MDFGFLVQSTRLESTSSKAVSLKKTAKKPFKKDGDYPLSSDGEGADIYERALRSLSARQATWVRCPRTWYTPFWIGGTQMRQLPLLLAS